MNMKSKLMVLAALTVQLLLFAAMPAHSAAKTLHVDCRYQPGNEANIAATATLGIEGNMPNEESVCITNITGNLNELIKDLGITGGELICSAETGEYATIFTGGEDPQEAIGKFKKATYLDYEGCVKFMSRTVAIPIVDGKLLEEVFLLTYCGNEEVGINVDVIDYNN